MQDIINAKQEATIQVITPQGHGTGFYLKEYNLIVTNNHVVGNNQEVTISGSNLNPVISKVLFYDTLHDLAFIEPPIDINLPELLLSGTPCIEGDQVLAIGHPYNLKYTITQGVISKAERLFNGLNYLQIDAAINPGNSGGPLLNNKGELIGVNTFIIQDGNNLGFSLPSNYLKESIKDFKSTAGKISLRCNSCSNIIAIDDVSDNYCPFCGAKTEIDKIKEEYEPVGIAILIEKTLEKLGKNVKLSRSGLNQWKVQEGSAEIVIQFNPNSGFLVGDAMLCMLPKEKLSTLYEFILKENYDLERAVFSVLKQDIILSFIIHAEFFNEKISLEVFEEIFNKSNYYDNILIEQYGALPRTNS